MTQYMGVSAFVAGWVTFAVVISDMITDPLIGALSDRSHSRFGRRRPMMVLGVGLMFVLTYLMFQPLQELTLRFGSSFSMPWPPSDLP